MPNAESPMVASLLIFPDRSQLKLDHADLFVPRSRCKSHEYGVAIII